MKNINKNISDVLISVAIPDYSVIDENINDIAKIATDLEREYKFWEILIIEEKRENNNSSNILRDIQNVRVIQVKKYTEFYIKRTIAAMEAIGDIVVLTSFNEIHDIDFVKLINKVSETDNLTVAKRKKRYQFDIILGFIGGITGYQVSLKNMLTAAYPRSILNQLLSQISSHVALRFPPTYLGSLEEIIVPTGNKRSLGGHMRRIALIQDLLFSVAPKLLTYVGTLCIIVTFCTILYSIYAIAVWALFENIQPGWLTLSLVLSLGLGFTSTSLFALSAGMKRLIDIASPEFSNYIVNESISTDMYGKIRDNFNVEK